LSQTSQIWEIIRQFLLLGNDDQLEARPLSESRYPAVSSYARYFPLATSAAKRRQRTVTGALAHGREALKIKGGWAYLYRVAGKSGGTVGFMLSGRRDQAAASPSSSQPLMVMTRLL